METQLASQQSLNAQELDESKGKEDNTVAVDTTAFVFDRTFKNVGLRITVNELTFIDTATQRYGVNMIIDRTWKASDGDLEHWTKLRWRPPDGQTIRDYLPDYRPIVNIVNKVEGSEEAMLWEEHGGEYTIQRKGDVYYNRYKVEANYTLTEEFEVESYPFDFQDLSIVIAPATSTIQQQRFVAHHILSDNYFTLSKTWSSITDWDVVALSCREYIIDLNNSWVQQDITLPKCNESWVNYKIQVKRRWKGIMLRVCLWMALLGLLSFCIFAHPREAVSDRMAFGITMILTLVAFQFVITSSLPRVNYLTLIDEYNLFIFSLNVCFMIESAVMGVDGIDDSMDADRADAWCIVGFGVLFVVGHVVFAIVSWCKNKEEWAKQGAPFNMNVSWFRQSNTLQDFSVTDEDLPKE
eukprot:63050_1